MCSTQFSQALFPSTSPKHLSQTSLDLFLNPSSKNCKDSGKKILTQGLLDNIPLHRYDQHRLDKSKGKGKDNYLFTGVMEGYAMTTTTSKERKISAYLTQALLIVTISIFSALTQAADILPKMVAVEEGKQYYTRYNFKSEKNKHRTTNYWRGEITPINTKVTLKSLSKKKIVLDVDGKKITLSNVKKHTKKDTQQIASELLSPTKLPLNKLPKKFANDIKRGVLRLGMTKDQVLMTRGYPPQHRTPSTEDDLWVYWNSRFVIQSLAFTNGKLTQARGVN